MNKIDRLYIVVTNNCNLRCTFCYVYNGNTKIKNFNFSKLKNLLKQKIKIKQFVLIGGEPLLNSSNIKSLIRHIRHYYKKSEIIITTNGLRLEKSIFDFLIKSKVIIQVTIYSISTFYHLLEKNIDISKIFFHITITKDLITNEKILNIFKIYEVNFWFSIDRRIDIDISDFLISNIIKGNIKINNFRSTISAGKYCNGIYGIQYVLNGNNLENKCLNLISYNLNKTISKSCINCNNLFCDACICEGIHLHREIICTIFKKIELYYKTIEGDKKYDKLK